MSARMVRKRRRSVTEALPVPSASSSSIFFWASLRYLQSLVEHAQHLARQLGGPVGPADVEFYVGHLTRCLAA